MWAQGHAALRADLERAVTTAAAYSLDYLAQTRPVVDNVEPARGYAAALALHVVGQPQPWAKVPPPLLHVHGYLVGVLDGSGTLRGPDRPSLYENTLALTDAQGQGDGPGPPTWRRRRRPGGAAYGGGRPAQVVGQLTGAPVAAD